MLTISMGVRLYFTMHFICIFLVIYDDVFVVVVACAFCLINCFSLDMPVNHLFICLFSEKKVHSDLYPFLSGYFCLALLLLLYCLCFLYTFS